MSGLGRKTISKAIQMLRLRQSAMRSNAHPTSFWSSGARPSGRYIREDFAEMVRSPDWQDATFEERREMVEDIKRDAREDARVDLGLDQGDNGGAGVPPPPPGFTITPPPPGLRSSNSGGGANMIFGGRGRALPPQSALDRRFLSGSDSGPHRRSRGAADRRRARICR